MARSALAVGRTLVGESPPEMGSLIASEEGSETIFAVAKYQSQFWKNIDVRSCEPREGSRYFLSTIKQLTQYQEDYEEVTWTIPGERDKLPMISC